MPAEAFVKVFGQMLGAVHGAVLPACTAERELQMREVTIYVALHVEVSQSIDMREEIRDFPIVLKELYHGRIQSRQLFVLLVASRIVGGAAIKHVAATVPTLISRNAAFVGKRIDGYRQHNIESPLPAPPLGECPCHEKHLWEGIRTGV